MTLPTDDNERKGIQLSAQWKLFPKATVALAGHIQAGADKYCGGEIKWDRSKSPDEVGSLMRHLFEYIQSPSDGVAKAIAWRGMALLEKELESTEAQDEGAMDEVPSHIPTILAEFLRSEGALDEFMDCADHDDWQKSAPPLWLYLAMDWDYTPSGGRYWSEIDDLWEDVCFALDEEYA